MKKVIALLIISLITPLVLSSQSEAAVKFLPGAESANDPYAAGHGNGGYDVENYTISLNVKFGTDSQTSITATTVITAIATQNLSRFSLDLDQLKTTKVSIDNKIVKYSTSKSKVFITPKNGILKGKKFTTAISYEGQPGSYIEEGATEPNQGWLKTKTGILAVGDPYVASYWFPVNDHPSDKASYKISITAPDSLTAISNGNLQSDPISKNGTKTWVWIEKYPMAPFNSVLAIGNYNLIKSEGYKGIPIISAFERTATADQELVIRKALAFISPTLELYEKKFGKYPFETSGAIISDIPLNYAMETQERPLYSLSNLISYGENISAVVIHELAHQWYAGSVTPKRWTDIWLNEGFATYSQWIWNEDNGLDKASSQFNFWYTVTPENIPHKKSITGDVAFKALWNVKVGAPPVASLFGKAVYVRGAMTLQVLRNTIGDDAFFAILKEWAEKKAYGYGNTQEFIALAQSKTKVDLTKLFNDWLYTDTKPTILNYAQN